MGRALIVVNGNTERARAANWCQKAPAGTRIEFKAAKRTLAQNDRMWAMLRWATRRENEADKKIHGTILTGQKNPAAKLSLIQVDEILHSLSSHRKIAAKYGVSSSTVGRIKRGENWGNHV